MLGIIVSRVSENNVGKYRMIAYPMSTATLTIFCFFLPIRDDFKLIEGIVMDNIALLSVSDQIHCPMLNVSLVSVINLGKYISTITTVIIRIVSENSLIKLG